MRVLNSIYINCIQMLVYYVFKLARVSTHRLVKHLTPRLAMKANWRRKPQVLIAYSACLIGSSVKDINQGAEKSVRQLMES